MPEETEPEAAENLDERLREVEEMVAAGQYAAAAVVGEELVNTHPESAAAHAVLADTYAARQMWPEATEWYELAVQLGAGPEVNQTLEKARRRLVAYSAEAPDEPQGVQLHRERARLWWIFGGAAAAVLLGIGIVLSGLLSPLRPTALTSEPPVATGSFRPLRSTDSGATLPPARPLPRPARPAPSRPQPVSPGRPAPPSRTAGSHPPVVITREMMGPVTDREHHLARALGSLSWEDGTPMSNAVAVVMDPYTGYAIITFEIPRALQVDELLAAVVWQSYSLAATAFRTDAGINWLTIRAIATITTPDKEDRTVVAYRANTRRGTLEEWMKLREDITMEELWNEVFATTWWNPSVPTDRLQ